jgi:hypothetical protein
MDRHFRKSNVSLVLTGGEPLIDTGNMNVLLKNLTGKDWINNIRIDTNISWDPEKYSDVDPSKIWLMCTFHPSQVDDEKYFDKLKHLNANGWKIGMVNYVIYEDQVDLFEERWRQFAELGIPLHPNPLWDSRGKFSDSALSVLKKYLDPVDYGYRGGSLSPLHKKCLFPSVSYEMFQTGAIHVGCHPQMSGSIFDDILPKLPVGLLKCPNKTCVCLDKYSFLREVNRNTTLNPFEIYHELLIKRFNLSSACSY